MKNIEFIKGVDIEEENILSGYLSEWKNKNGDTIVMSGGWLNNNSYVLIYTIDAYSIEELKKIELEEATPRELENVAELGGITVEELKGARDITVVDLFNSYYGSFDETARTTIIEAETEEELLQKVDKFFKV